MLHFSFITKWAATNYIIRILIIDQSAAGFQDLIVELHYSHTAVHERPLVVHRGISHMFFGNRLSSIQSKCKQTIR